MTREHNPKYCCFGIVSTSKESLKILVGNVYSPEEGKIFEPSEWTLQKMFNVLPFQDLFFNLRNLNDKKLKNFLTIPSLQSKQTQYKDSHELDSSVESLLSKAFPHSDLQKSKRALKKEGVVLIHTLGRCNVKEIVAQIVIETLSIKDQEERTLMLTNKEKETILKKNQDILRNSFHQYSLNYEPVGSDVSLAKKTLIIN